MIYDCRKHNSIGFVTRHITSKIIDIQNLVLTRSGHARIAHSAAPVEIWPHSCGPWTHLTPSHLLLLLLLAEHGVLHLHVGVLLGVLHPLVVHVHGVGVRGGPAGSTRNASIHWTTTCRTQKILLTIFCCYMLSPFFHIAELK